MRLSGPDMGDIKCTRHSRVFVLIKLGAGGNVHANSDLINLGLGRPRQGEPSVRSNKTCNIVDIALLNIDLRFSYIRCLDPKWSSLPIGIGTAIARCSVG